MRTLPSGRVRGQGRVSVAVPPPREDEADPGIVCPFEIKIKLIES